jgi:hypothetical protein
VAANPKRAELRALELDIDAVSGSGAIMDITAYAARFEQVSKLLEELFRSRVQFVQPEYSCFFCIAGKHSLQHRPAKE